MTDSDKAGARAEVGWPAWTADSPLLDALRSRGTAFRAGIALAAIIVLGLGVLAYAMAGHGTQTPAGQQIASQATGPVANPTTDYVAGFENMCLPGATDRYAAVGFDSAQAKARATSYCHCVATAVAGKLTPDLLATAKTTGKMPDTLKSAIGGAVLACQ